MLSVEILNIPQLLSKCLEPIVGTDKSERTLWLAALFRVILNEF